MSGKFGLGRSGSERGRRSLEEPIRILLADDHALVRATLAAHLAAQPGLSVVGQVGTGDDALAAALRLNPDVVVLDIHMPGLLCFAAARTIRAQCPAARIIFLSAYFDDRYIDEALRVGADGYVIKDEPPETIAEAIRLAVAGARYFSAEVEARIVENAGKPGDTEARRSRVATLTPRELETLRYIASGLSKKEIARIMDIGVKTVDHHATALMTKLDIHDRVALTRFAIREGLAKP